MVIRKGSKTQLSAQRDELLALRGDMTQDDWVKVLGVPIRTYHRYEMGQRLAPEHLMRFARVAMRSGVGQAAEGRSSYGSKKKRR